VLYVPGDDEKKIKKIPSLKVDCAVLDCEDGVAANKKVRPDFQMRERKELKFAILGLHCSVWKDPTVLMLC
jgi:citrate lyase beta subunit